MIEGSAAFAESVADLVGGTVHPLPEDGAVAIALANGRMPLLVRDYGHMCVLSLAGKRAWTVKERQLAAGTRAEIREACQRWNEADAPLTIWEIGAELAERVSQARGETWTMRTPSPPKPRESWLHPPVHEAGSIGIFEGRVIVWGRSPEPWVFTTRSRAELLDHFDAIVAAVQDQSAEHARRVRLGERLGELAQALAARLEAALGAEARLSIWSRPPTSASIACAGAEVHLDAEGDVIAVHAGLVGPDGWHAAMDTVDDDHVEAIVAAMKHARESLTLERLVVGRRYRVREAIGELLEGMRVRFEGFDDIDNHYGQYIFTSTEGQRLAVSGDYSTPRRSPLAQTHRYLEELEARDRE